MKYKKKWQSSAGEALCRREEGLGEKKALVPCLWLDVGQLARLAVGGGLAQRLVVHVVEGDTALLLHGGRGRGNQQGMDRTDGPVGRIAVGQEERRGEVGLRGVDGVGGHGW